MENCIFSKIARGESDTQIIYEDNQICAFNDISPAADTHILIIPKRPIKNMNYLKNTEEDINLVKHMEDVGKKLIKDHVKNDEYRIGFTQPPFNTVPYLHMHVLSLPITCNRFRAIFLNPKTLLWTPEKIIERLQNSK
ncbi:histidine triad nucleotide-binding protein 3-like protein [Neocallimastix lanati (nom. inval.)]|uniref:Histidine triad nucleotide-binding protein 3-like protein n=1 Tax=Neocallimastix californiae TaxID=1754190 RepID=A0A1Y2FNR0_9FUNG|nr:histidine triad nucleotide-binding protein 3-like protein [Neocallimastix sp. JGI-2020a]ORY85237.1 histidine triad nucleotide-binding protein 3-like protein [Neocallimastix californiae]|eukprot:ORY85237.1 histidine triad nucleotide-binding protein 3-like protein [Neocallimastix californiae]